MGSIAYLPTKPEAVVRNMLTAAVAQLSRPRFELCAWADGYVIYDRGDLICTFHGPQLDLAGRLLRLLQEDAERPEPPQAA